MTSPIDRINILRDISKRLHEIKHGHTDFHSQHATEQGLWIECRILYRTIEWDKGQVENNERVMFFNVIFLKRFNNHKYKSNNN